MHASQLHAQRVRLVAKTQKAIARIDSDMAACDKALNAISPRANLFVSDAAAIAFCKAQNAKPV